MAEGEPAEKPAEKPEKDVGSYRSRRIESSQKSKIRDKKVREIEICTTNIENLEDTIKEMETAIDYIYRIVSIGTDRHRQQHYVFPGLPIIIEKPVNISKQGQILHSQWFYINDEDEYFNVAKTGLSKFGICESRLKKEILNIMREQIKDNFEMYREALVGDDVGDENEDNDENEEIDENEEKDEKDDKAENEEKPEEMSDDENSDSKNDKKPAETDRSRNPSGISTNSSSSPLPSPESEILTRIGSILEKSTKSNQIALGNCLSVPEKDLDSNTALEQLQIEMSSPDFQLKTLIINILKNTYMKCLTFPLVDAEIRENWETEVEKLKVESAKCDFSFLVFVLDVSINSVNRRGRRANSNDLTLEEHLLQVVEDKENEVEEVESETDENDVEEEVESEGEIVYSRSGRRQKQIKRYVDEFEHREESEEEIVPVKRGSYKKTETQKAKEKKKPVKKYFDEFESPEILPTTSRRKTGGGGNKLKKEASRASGRTSGRTSRKTYKDSSSDEEEEEEDMEESQDSIQDDEIFEKLPSRSRRNR